MPTRLPEIMSWQEDQGWSSLPPERKQRVLGNYFDKEIADSDFHELDQQRQGKIKANFIAAHSVIDRTQDWTPGDMPVSAPEDELSAATPDQQQQPPEQQPQPEPQQEPETPQQMVGRFVQDSVANDPFLAGLDVDIDDQLADLDSLFAEPETDETPAIQPEQAVDQETRVPPMPEDLTMMPEGGGVGTVAAIPKTEGDTGDLWGQSLQNLIRAGAGIFDYAQSLNRAATKYGLDKSITGEKYVSPDLAIVSDAIRSAVDEMDVEQPTGEYARSPEKLREYLTDPKRFAHLVATNAPTTAALAILTTIAPATAVATMNAIEGGQTAETKRAYEKETGRKLDSHQATLAPFVVGAINAALEKTGIDKILNTSGAWKGAKDAVKKVMFSALVEGGTEGLQETNQVVTEILTDQGLDPKYADRIVANAVAGLGSGGGLTAAGGATATMYENTGERKEARLRSEAYTNKIKKEARQATKEYLEREKAAEVEAAPAAEEAPEAVTPEVEESAPTTEYDADIEDILDAIPEEEEIAPVGAAPEAEAVETTPDMPEGEIAPEVAPVEGETAEKVEEPAPSALAFEESRAEREAARVVPEATIEREVEEERRVADVSVDIERRLAEQEPIVELDAEQVTFVNETVRNLGSVEAVVERFPSEDATDRYARQRAEKEFGAGTKPSAESVSTEPVTGTAEMKAEPEKMTPKMTAAEPVVEPVSGVTEEINEPILATSGRPYKTKAAARRRANALGEGYEVIPHGDAFAVQKATPVEPVEPVEPTGLTSEQRAEQELDKYERELEDEDIPLATKSERPAGEPGMGVIDLERALGPIKGKYHIPISIVGGIEDLPTQRLRDSAEATQKKGAIISGLYDRGTAYLIGDGIRDANEALLVMSHEVVGHGGVELLLGEGRYTRFLKNLQRDKFISPAIEQMAKDRKITVESAAKEWFAEKAEGENFEKLPDNIIKRIIYWFRETLRSMGMARFMRFTDADITNLIRRSYKYTKGPKVAKAAAKTDPTLRAGEPQREWYSQMQNIVGAKLPGKGTVPGFRKMIESWANKGEFKAEELEWSGLLDDPTSPLSKEFGKVTKQEVVDWLEANNVRVEEVWKGDKDKPNYLGVAREQFERDFPEDFDSWMYDSQRETLSEKWDELSSGQQEKYDNDLDIFYQEEYNSDIEILLGENTYNELKEGLWQTVKDEYVERIETEREFEHDLGTKFSAYQLPGGENYREVLITLPETGGAREIPQGYFYYTPPGSENWQILDENKKKFAEGATPEEAKQNAIKKLGEKPAVDFRGSHWDEPNVVAHLRLNDRTDADGKKVLFVEEVQSDWGQKGREEGFKDKPLSDRDKARWRELNERAYNEFTDKEKAEWGKLNIKARAAEGQSGVPRGALVEQTQTWSLLAIKKAIRIAAEGGYDKIAWTTGEQQAERYDLSKWVDRVVVVRTDKDSYALAITGKDGRPVYSGEITKDMPASKLADHIGKELADRAIGELDEQGARQYTEKDLPVGASIKKHRETPGYGTEWRVESPHGQGYYGIGKGEAIRSYLQAVGVISPNRVAYSGPDLKVGGVGMKVFYDKMLPAAVNKYVKKWGGRVGKTTTAGPWDIDEHIALVATEQGRELTRREAIEETGDTVHSLPITPAMQQAALMGQPLFRTRSLDTTLRELKQVYKILDELPDVRNNKPTTTIRERLEAKVKELEARVGDIGGISYRTRKAEGPRLQKALASLEAHLPEKGKDETVKHRTSTLIRQQIAAVKRGHLLGARDMKEALGETKRLILHYARKNLPKDGITRGQVRPLLTALAQAKDADDVASAYNKIDKITRTVTSKKLVGDIDKLLKRYKPKTKGGKITGTVLTADEYSDIADIRAVVAMKPDAVRADIEDILKEMDLRAADKDDISGGEPTDAEAERLYRLDKFGDLKNKTVAQLKQAKAELQSIIDTGRTKRKEQNEARMAAVKGVKETSIDFLTSGKGLLSQEAVAALGGVKREGAIRKAFQEQLTFEYLLDELSRSERGAAPLRGTLNKFFMPKIHAARNAESKGVREGMAEFRDKLAEIFGTTNPKDLLKLGTAHTIPENVGVSVKQDGKSVPLVLSQEQAYKLWQEWQDPTLADTFTKQGYTQETMDAIEKFIDPGVMEWANWQMYEFYPKYYETINRVFRERYGVDLPYNPFYTPISRVYEGSDKQDDQLLTDNKAQFSAVVNNHLKGRVKNTRPLKLLGGDSVLMRHLIEMEHFKAWAEPMRDLRSYFGDEKIRTAIKQNFGPHMMKKIDDFVNDFARGGIDPKLVVDFLDKRRKNFTTAVLGLNFTLMPKQLASIPAYAADIPLADFVAGTTEFLINPRGKFKTLMESELLKARYELGWDRDIMLALQRTEQQQLSGKRKMLDKAMFPTKIGDRIAILIGGWSVYKYHYEQAKAKGKSEKEAKDIAMYEFEASTSRSQQSGNLEDLPAIMRGGSWPRLFTMFQTAPASYFRMEASAWLNLKRNRGSRAAQAKRLAIAHFILPMLFQYVANGLRWRDEDQLRAAILGSLNGLLIVGKWLETGTQALVSKLMGARSYFFGIGSNPVFESLDEAKRLVQSAGVIAADGTIDWKDAGKTLDGSLKFISKITGHPYAAPARMAEGVYEAAAHKRVDPRKIGGYSGYALGEHNIGRDLKDAIEAHFETPSDERDPRIEKQLDAEREDYNKSAHKNDEPLIKMTEWERLKRTPRAVVADLVYRSSGGVLGDASIKRFYRKIELALENKEIKQKKHDEWVATFEKNQAWQRQLRQGYYEQGLEVPRATDEPGAPSPPRPMGPPKPSRRY